MDDVGTFNLSHRLTAFEECRRTVDPEDKVNRKSDVCRTVQHRNIFL